MKTPLLLLLLLSLSINGVLTAMLRSAPDPSPVRSAAAGNRSAPVLAGRSPARPTNQDQAAGSADRAVMLARLEDEWLAEARAAASAYWRSGQGYELAFAAAVLDAQDRIRAELVAAYGESAPAEAAFRRLFRPLDPMFSFLSSTQQLAVQRLRFEREQAMQAAARAGGAAAARTGLVNDGARQAAEAYAAGLAELLEPATLFEFLLRDSMLAQQLRASEVEFSENEFRQTFAVLHELERTAPDIDAVVAARDSLRGLLGDRRFAALWAARDPLHARLATVAAGHGLDSRTTAAAYQIVAEYQDRMLRAAARAGNDPEAAAAAASRLAAEEREALTRLVGDAAAADLLAARAVESYRLFQDSME